MSQTELPVEITLRLSGYISACFHEAQTHRDSSGVTERLLQCARQRAGIYDPKKAAEIREQGGSDIYMLLTDTKCRAAESWIRDVLLSAMDRTYAVAPSPIADLPPEVSEGIMNTVMVEALQLADAGMAPNEVVIELRMEEVFHEVVERMREAASEAADRMQDKIDDILAECGWEDTYSEIITDFCTYPFAIWEGPILRRKPVLKWGRNFKPLVEEKIVETAERFSPFDAFWSPNATSPQDGYFIRRMRMNRALLSACMGAKGYNDSELEKALDNYGQSGFRFHVNGDTERAELEGKSSTAVWASDSIEVLSFWGSVSGEMLREWGMADVELYREYEVNAWLVGNYTVRCVLNPHPLKKRPFSKRSFSSVPGAFCGKALPELMRDVQTMCNAAARALQNNMGIASGPQVEVYTDRIPPGSDITEQYPWKIWQFTSDRTGGGQRAINWHQPDMKAAELMSVFQFFLKLADEVTGIPNYIYGSSQVSGAGRTSSGLAMLMENAAKGIKQAILSLDRGVSEMIVRIQEHLLYTSSDNSIKGDARIVPTGVVATLMKDQVRMRRQEFLNSTANPIDAQIIDLPHRTAVLREQAKDLNMNVDDAVPTVDEVEAKMEQAALLAQQQQLLMAQQGGMPQ